MNSTRHTYRYLILLATLPLLAIIVMMAQGSPTIPAAVPVTLVEGVTSYEIRDPKIFYGHQPTCGPILGRDSINILLEDAVGRTSVSGMVPRKFFQFFFDCPSSAGDLFSNVVGDDDYVYWMSLFGGGLVRQSTDALPSDLPERVSPFPVQESEIVLVDGFIYMIKSIGGEMFRFNLATGRSAQLTFDNGLPAADLQSDGTYLYWRAAKPGGDPRNWVLKRRLLAAGPVTTIVDEAAPGVLSTIAADDGSGITIGFKNSIRFYDNSAGSLSSPLYTSDVPAEITSIARDEEFIYFFRRQIGPPTGGDQLYRLPLSTGALALLHTSPTDPGEPLVKLQEHDGFLYFLEQADLMRLPADLGLDPPVGSDVINMRITGIEITQGIQSDDNRVRLIQGRRTAVRLFVESDGAPVPGATAELYRINASGTVIDGPLLPINLIAASAYLTVQPAPSRDNIDESFLFLLPPEWTDGLALRVRAELNPAHYPTEPDYADNTLSTTLLALERSPRLQTHFVLYEYDSGGTRYRPRFREDYLQTVSWMRRAYPFASAGGWGDDPGRGFRPGARYLFDEALGGNVDGTDQDRRCICRLTLGDPTTPAFCEGLDLEGGGRMDDPGLCAAYFVTSPGLDTIRAVEGIAPSIFLYGLVDDGGGFPRGTAGVLRSVGPSGCCSWAWDSDGTYADWYSGHEIGHPQNRPHTFQDPDYPYLNQAIGDATMRGFDVGDVGLNSLLTPRVYPSNMWTDVMSYEANQWISDYTYEAILDWLFGRAAVTSPRPQASHSEYLQLSGLIWTEAGNADVTQARRWQSLNNPPVAPGQGNYRIRLLKSNDDELAVYSFNPDEIADTEDPVSSFSEVVPFHGDAAKIVIDHPASSQTLWEYEVSPHIPVVEEIVLSANASPVTGQATLEWSADDADGDLLTYDVLYSKDDGKSWQVIQMNLSGSSSKVDTDRLAGSQVARFKVIANDGLNQGEGISPPTNVALKKPLIIVTNPVDGIQVPFGTTLLFAAEVYDLQDENVDPKNIQWRNQKQESVGTGLSFATSDLLIGQNEIFVTATNSFGLSETVKFTVWVNDDLAVPGTSARAGPDQISWRTSKNDTALQTAEIRVVNAGGGQMRVAAAENAPWLTVEVTGSSAPFTLKLTADPTLVHSGQTAKTILEITTSGSPNDQEIKVPITLSRGDSWGPVPDEDKLYMPLLIAN